MCDSALDAPVAGQKATIPSQELKEDAACKFSVPVARVSACEPHSSSKVTKAVESQMDGDKPAEQMPTGGKEERTVEREEKPTEAKAADIKVLEHKAAGNIAAKERTTRAVSSESRTAAESIDAAARKGRDPNPRGYALPSQAISAPVIVDLADKASVGIINKAIAPEMKPSSIDILDLVAKGYWYRELVELNSRTRNRMQFGLSCVKPAKRKVTKTDLTHTLPKENYKATQQMTERTQAAKQRTARAKSASNITETESVPTLPKNQLQEISPLQGQDFKDQAECGSELGMTVKGQKATVPSQELKEEATCNPAINETDARVLCEPQNSSKIAKAVEPQMDGNKPAKQRPTGGKEERTVERQAEPTEARAAGIKETERKAEENNAAKQRTAREVLSESRTAAESIGTAAQKGRGANPREYALPSQAKSAPVVVYQADKTSVSIINKGLTVEMKPSSIDILDLVAKGYSYRELVELNSRTRTPANRNGGSRTRTDLIQTPSKENKAAEQNTEKLHAARSKQRTAGAVSTKKIMETKSESVDIATRKGREAKPIKPSPCNSSSVLPSQMASAPAFVDLADKGSIIVANKTLTPDMKPSRIDIQELFANGYWYREVVGLNKCKTQTTRTEAGPSTTPQLPDSRTQKREDCGTRSVSSAKGRTRPVTEAEKNQIPPMEDKTVEQRKEMAHFPLPPNSETSGVIHARGAFNSLLAATSTPVAASQSVPTKVPLTTTLESAATQLVASPERRPAPALSAPSAITRRRNPVESAGIGKSATAISTSASAGVVGNHCTNKDFITIDTGAEVKLSVINIKELMSRGHWAKESVISRDSELKLKAANKQTRDISAQKELSLSTYEVKRSQQRKKTCSLWSCFRGSRD